MSQVTGQLKVGKTTVDNAHLIVKKFEEPARQASKNLILIVKKLRTDETEKAEYLAKSEHPEDEVEIKIEITTNEKVTQGGVTLRRFPDKARIELEEGDKTWELTARYSRNPGDSMSLNSGTGSNPPLLPKGGGQPMQKPEVNDEWKADDDSQGAGSRDPLIKEQTPLGEGNLQGHGEDESGFSLPPLNVEQGGWWSQTEEKDDDAPEPLRQERSTEVGTQQSRMVNEQDELVSPLESERQQHYNLNDDVTREEECTPVCNPFKLGWFCLGECSNPRAASVGALRVMGVQQS